EKLPAGPSGLDTYAAHFAALAAAKRKLGLDADSGLEGTLRKSVHDVEDRLKGLDNTSLQLQMLTMRRHEKDFMLGHDARYGEAMKKAAAEFADTLHGAALPPAARTEMAEKLAAYQRDYFAWMDGSQVVAREQKAMSDAFAAVDPKIEEVHGAVAQIMADAAAGNSASRARMTLLVELVSAAAAFAAALLAFLIGRAVSRPLHAMTDTMRELAAGNLDVEVGGANRADEVGQMAQAVTVFKSNALERVRL